MGSFYTHCVVALIILTADYFGKLEPTVKKIEQNLGIPVYYAPSDSVGLEINDPYLIEDLPQQDTFNNQRNNDESNS